MDEAGMATVYRNHADRIGPHVVDTRGGSDEHLPVGIGIIDFATILSGLEGPGLSGTATLEIGTDNDEAIAFGIRHVAALLDAT